MKTVAIDFDGVIHKYRKGWQDGSIYDELDTDVVKWMYDLMGKDYAIYIHTSRNPWQVAKKMREQYPYFGAMSYDLATGYDVSVVPFWAKFWNRNDCLGVSRRKLPAIVYIDDRAIRYNGINSLNSALGLEKKATGDDVAPPNI